MITLALLMSTCPCPRYPRKRVAQILKALNHPRTWMEFAERARDAGWEHGPANVSLADLRLTAYRAATPKQRQRAVREVTRWRVVAQIARWPEVTPAVRAVRERLLAWCATGEGDIWQISDAARDAAAARAANVDYTRAAAARAAAYVAAYAAAADAVAAADAAFQWRSLIRICEILDEGQPRSASLSTRRRSGRASRRFPPRAKPKNAVLPKGIEHEH